MKSALLARLPFVLYFIAIILVRATAIFRIFSLYRRRNRSEPCCLAIEAGAQGWNNIEFKEIHRSAEEFLGTGAVVKVVIDKSKSYVSQVREVLSNPEITHYLYDTRTGRQDFWNACLESLQISILMAQFGVVPIVYLTDLSVRIWRCQAAAVSAVSGVAAIFMMPRCVQGCFPHRRLVGPSLMPISTNTLETLIESRGKLVKSGEVQPVVRFTGSLYEPRTSFLKKYSSEMQKAGRTVEILGREIGTARVTDDVYWNRLSSAYIVITTADQMIQTGTDWSWIPHMVYRYLEVLAAGSLLLAPAVPGITRYFKPGKHFVCFESVDDAVNKSLYYLDHPDEAEIIAKTGHEKAAHLIRSNSFWVQIDSALGYESLTS